MRLRSGIFAALGALVLLPLRAQADVEHVIGRGHTIESIANRYHVKKEAIVAANHLKDVKHLHPGDVLVIPTKGHAEGENGKSKSKSRGASASADGLESGSKPSKAEKGGAHESYAMKAKTPGVLHVHR